MGPRSIDRGILATLIVAVPALHASMGPRSIDRGIARLLDKVRLEAALQWGRDQLIAELRNQYEQLLLCGRFNGAAIN